MLYAMLCYNNEDAVFAWSKDQEEAVMANLELVHQKLVQQGRMGPAVRLLPTTAATSLRKGDEPLVLDGPFVETKEQLLGFYIIDCADLEAALEVARDLAKANPGDGGYEIRPLHLYRPGGDLPAIELG